MKLIFILTLLGCQVALAQTNSNFFPILRCKDRTYTNATIENITPATVDISWGSSGERTSITNLPDQLQARYHYNQRRAQKYLDAQAAEKAAHEAHETQSIAAVVAVENTLGPPQNIRIIKPMLFPGSIQIEVDGVLAEAFIPNLPPEVLNFATNLSQLQSNAASLRASAQQVRAESDRLNAIVQGTSVNDPNFAQELIDANLARANASVADSKTADAEAQLRKLQVQAKERAIIVARPTGKMITPHIRQWQFQAMAAANPANISQVAP